jgi:hypothetical protein
MIHARTFAICALGIVCSAHVLDAQGLSQYRKFELGSDVASVSTLAGVAATDARVIHQRPAILQDLDWRPSRWVAGSIASSTDPVERIRFSFYNDRLFRVVVDYGSERTQGMTPADMIDAISAVYGTAVLRSSGSTSKAASRLEADSGSSLARWGDVDHTVTLFQTSSSRAAFRLIVTDVRLDSLATDAEAQAIRLDDQEAPRREIARQQKERDDASAAAAKARDANKGAFRP